MNNEKIVLTTQDILDKEFKIDASGYRPQEVDKFLDIIIKDYTEYNNLTRMLYKKNKALQEEINQLKSEIRHLKEMEDVQEEVNSNTSKIQNNVDILKRLSNLEKTVYGKNE